MNMSLKQLPVDQFMTPRPDTVTASDNIAFALHKMDVGGYRHLPVVNEGGRPVGILSVKRILHYLAEHFPATIYNLPPDPAAIPLERDGA